jgi:hypothetical protein
VELETVPTALFTGVLDPWRPPGVKKPKTPPWSSFEPDLVTAVEDAAHGAAVLGQVAAADDVDLLEELARRPVPIIPKPGFDDRVAVDLVAFSSEEAPRDREAVGVGLAPGVTSATDSNERAAEPLPDGGERGTRRVNSV